jgi:hypothetical protein
MLEGNLYERYLSPACCLSWMPAPPTIDEFLEVGCGFTRNKKQKRSQWGSILRKSSQEWIKIEIWQMEFGLR